MASGEAPNTTPLAPPPAASRETDNKQPELRSARNGTETEALGVTLRENFQSFLDIDAESLDSNYTYRWVRKDKLGVTRAKMKGYVAVDPQSRDGKKIRNTTGERPEVSADGLYSVGDLILMRTPSRNHRRRKKLLAKKGEQRLGVAKKKFTRLVRKAGVDVHSRTFKEQE